MRQAADVGEIKVSKWGMVELDFGPERGAFRAADVRALFQAASGGPAKEIDAFADGANRVLVRFMPDEEGEWTCCLAAASPDNDNAEREAELLAGTAVSGIHAGRNGWPEGGLIRLLCGPPEQGNRGVVRVAGENGFAYEDGTPYDPFGTTALLGWKPDRLERMAAALASSPFNKVRLYVQPHSADEEGLDRAVRLLCELGIEAELLLDCDEGDAPYVRALVAKLAAYRNVWWCLLAGGGRNRSGGGAADEWARLIRECDPYGHLLSIHTDDPFGGFAQERVTHLSLKWDDPTQLSRFAAMHRKPVIADDCGSEGDAPSLRQSLPAEELVHRIWGGVCRKTYAGHGESFADESGETWATGGSGLHGDAPRRIAFLRSIVNEAPAGLEPMTDYYDAPTIGIEGRYYLQYHGIHRYPNKQLRVPPGRYEAELIDTWNMTVTPLSIEEGDDLFVTLPGRLYQALRIRNTDLSSPSGNAGEQRYADDRGHARKPGDGKVSEADPNDENFISDKEQAKR